MTPRKELKDLNLMDRFLFAEAADDPEFMEHLLTIIFDKEIHLKHPPQTEKEQRSLASGKQIRLDVWAVDENGVVYDTEPQRQNTQNLPKRSRYYQGVIDSKLLEAGEVDYNNLRNVFIVTITGFDLFGDGLYCHTFRMACRENAELELADGAARVFLNTRGTNGQDISPELAALLEYLEHTTDKVAEQSGSWHIQKMHEKVKAIKASEEKGVKYMQAWEEKAYARLEGEREGVEKGEKRFAALTQTLLKAQDTRALSRAAEDAEYRKELYLKYGI